MIPVSAPRRVRDHLRETPDGAVPLVHRGRDAVYVDVAGRCVGVVGTRATAVPCALRTTLDSSTSPPPRWTVACCTSTASRWWSAESSTSRSPGSSDAPAWALPGDVRQMVGRGDGLTPYEDDVICGWLAIHRAAGVSTTDVDAAVRDCLHRTTLLSATLLDCAMHGEVIPEFAAYVAALGTPAETTAAAALAAVGHTSGAGMLAGARSALESTEGAA